MLRSKVLPVAAISGRKEGEGGKYSVEQSVKAVIIDKLDCWVAYCGSRALHKESLSHFALSWPANGPKCKLLAGLSDAATSLPGALISCASDYASGRRLRFRGSRSPFKNLKQIKKRRQYSHSSEKRGKVICWLSLGFCHQIPHVESGRRQ
jgi:hypothetical protein